MHTSKEIGTAILAGGLSTRMGTNKALLRAYEGGPTVIEQVIARLRDGGANPDLLVTNTPEEYRFTGLPTIPDDIPGAGSLGGILTALQHSPYVCTLIVGCDMPLLSPPLVRYMLSLRGDYDALVPRWTDKQGRIRRETLHAVYSKHCIEPILARVKSGRLKVMDLLDELSVRYVDESDLRRFDPDLAGFHNINTPEDWAQLQTRV